MSPARPEVSRAELERRVEAVQRELAERGIDAVLVADEPNYRYLTGHFTESWLNRARPCACWLPARGEPVLVVCESEEEWARATSWWPAVATYGGPVLGPEILGAPEVGFEPEIAPAVLEAARRLALPKSPTLGLPSGSRSRVQLPLDVTLAIRAGIPGASWIDATAALLAARAVKSPEELRAVRAAVAALDHAMPRTLAAVREGMTEIEVARIQRALLFAGGADHVGYTNVVADLTGPLFSAPAQRSIRKGEMFYVDGGAVVDGYWSDYCRLGVVGEASADVVDAYALLVEALDAGIATVREGVTAGEVATRMGSVLEAGAGAGGLAIGRMGHGNGLEMPEPPSIHPDDATPLVAGMVICIEPNLHVEGIGTVVVEDMVVVTENGAEPLSDNPTPREIPVL